MSLNEIIYNCDKFKAELDYQWKRRLLQHEMELLPSLKKISNYKTNFKSQLIKNNYDKQK